MARVPHSAVVTIGLILCSTHPVVTHNVDRSGPESRPRALVADRFDGCQIETTFVAVPASCRTAVCSSLTGILPDVDDVRAMGDKTVGEHGCTSVDGLRVVLVIAAVKYCVRHTRV